MSVDWSKPIRFTRVQDDNHAHYRPRYVGSYLNDVKRVRHVVCLRYWDHAVSFIVYDEGGKPIPGEHADNATAATGVYDATIVNGPEITTQKVEVRGAWIDVTFDGDEAVKAQIIRAR